jgi:Mg-chelatase subunit ChlD
LVIYLLDTSSSMATPMSGFLKDGGSRIAVVRNAVDKVLRRMVSRSTKGARISPRYDIAVAAYNHLVQPLTANGPESVDRIAIRGVPRLSSDGLTFTAQAFEWAEKLLIREFPRRADHPAPLICHMTDGEFNGDADPEPVVRRISRMANQDGSVLVLNISSATR